MTAAFLPLTGRLTKPAGTDAHVWALGPPGWGRAAWGSPGPRPRVTPPTPGAEAAPSERGSSAWLHRRLPRPVFVNIDLKKGPAPAGLAQWRECCPTH